MKDRKVLAAMAWLALVVAAGSGGQVSALSSQSAAPVDDACSGLRPTIVGGTSGQVNGTAGDDVILSQGARVVAGPGDDTVCQRGSNTAADDLGPGDDSYLMILTPGVRIDVVGGSGRNSLSAYSEETLSVVQASATVIASRRAAGSARQFRFVLGFAEEIRFRGSSGRDFLSGTACSIFMQGGGSDDRLAVSGPDEDDSPRRDCGEDGVNATVTGGPGDDSIRVGGPGSSGDRIRLFGGRGDDGLVGGRSVDRLEGGLGRDSLSGRDGPDLLEAGAGRDKLNGGGGFDSIDGGPGRDRATGAAQFARCVDVEVRRRCR